MSTITTDNFTHRATGDSVPAQYLVHGSAKVYASYSGAGGLGITFGVSSIVNNGTGDNTVNFTTAMASSNYVMTFGARNGSGASDPYLAEKASRVTNAIRTQSMESSSGSFINITLGSVVILGDPA